MGKNMIKILHCEDEKYGWREGIKLPYGCPPNFTLFSPLTWTLLIEESSTLEMNFQELLRIKTNLKEKVSCGHDSCLQVFCLLYSAHEVEKGSKSYLSNMHTTTPLNLFRL